MIILSHVKDGYEMGVKYKLPSIILDCILEHLEPHLSVFYSKALAKEGEGSLMMMNLDILVRNLKLKMELLYLLIQLKPP